ncbi:hypothetical protein GUJ93_ZPchr0010g8686 [Zizania palustris]|uniref:Uncharacterized protein n=1 Tax=Zizania palustris TaxID=103762 RepID=A0A8J6BDN7_ZIZPA|nr:hypothetical protein GUJ93_ZPchr0286g2796 [Zizania palustris]KAG8086172.1 hypothetical protein GUJ93_ZPchr0010g8686 [Zizania palustris]
MGMGSSRGGVGSEKRGAPAWLAVCLLLLLLRCSPCEARKLVVVQEERGEVMHFEGGLVLRVGGGGGVVVGSPARPSGLSVIGRAERIMRSVPSPGVGH